MNTQEILKERIAWMMAEEAELLPDEDSVHTLWLSAEKFKCVAEKILTAQEGESDKELVSILEDAGYEVVEGYEKVKQLIGVAKTAHNLADDTEEENGVYTITKDNADELGKVLDKLELPTPPKEGE